MSATANGIAMFMLYGAGLWRGCWRASARRSAPTVETIAHDIAIALPFEGLYQAALHALGSNQTGLTQVLVNLGPFGSSHPNSTAFVHLGSLLSCAGWASRHRGVRTARPLAIGAATPVTGIKRGCNTLAMHGRSDARIALVALAAAGLGARGRGALSGGPARSHAVIV